MKRSISLALGGVLLALTAWAPGAMAAGMLVVDKDGFATPTNCNASTPTPYTTIQSAVNAAGMNQAIKVCPGTYVETVTVNTAGVRLLGAFANVSAKGCPNRGPGLASVIGGKFNAINLNADRTVVNGFQIENTSSYGVYTNPNHSGYRIVNNVIEDNAGGVYLNASGNIDSQVAWNCIRQNNTTFGDATPFPTAGTGIYTDQGLKNAIIANNSFSRHLNMAINLATAQAPNPVTDTSNIRILRNTSTNDRTFLATYSARKVYVASNTIRQDSGGQADNGSAIYIGGGADVGGGDGSRSITITSNTITSTQKPHGFYAGIAVRASADGVVISYNLIRGTYNGINITGSAPGAAYVRQNRIRNVQNWGLSAESPASQNVFGGNRVSGSGKFDCYDNTTGTEWKGVNNTWTYSSPGRNIVAGASFPAGLCPNS